MNTPATLLGVGPCLTTASDYAGKFVTKLCDHIVAGGVTAAAVLVNNHICFPSKHTRFHNVDNVPARSPLQRQAVLGFGGDKAGGFNHAFEQFGVVVEVVR